MSTTKNEVVPELTVTLTFKPQVGFGRGFRQEWLSAKANGVEAALDCGAGLGNPMFTFWIERQKGKRAYFDVDVREVLRTLIEQADKKIIAQALAASEKTIRRRAGP